MTALATQRLRSVEQHSWSEIIQVGYGLTGAPGVKGHLEFAHGEWVNDLMGKAGWPKRVGALHALLHADPDHLMPIPHHHKED